MHPGVGVLSAVGSTPLVQLSRLFADSDATFYAKLEAANPAGSVKDRAALSMVTGAIRSRALIPGRSVVVESSSGNLGIGLAQVCRWFGIRFVCVVDPKATAQNIAILKAYGAEVEVVAIPDNAMDDYLSARIRRVQELVQEIPDAFWPNQYANPLNAAGQEMVMREIVADLNGKVDYVFIATGSCGTAHGCARFIREHGLPTRIIAVDAAGSAIFGQPARRRLIPGHGAAVRPGLWYEGIADEVIHVTDHDCVVGCRKLMAAEAIFCGGSSGAVVGAVNRMRAGIPAGSTCVLVMPDRGERYLDTIYSDTWVDETFGDIRHLWKETVRC
jgi:cysteine synthase A